MRLLIVGLWRVLYDIFILRLARAITGEPRHDDFSEVDMLADAEMRKLLAEIKSIAIIGAKDKPGQPVDNVGAYLINAGYEVIPVHPVRRGVWGLETYANIRDIPHTPDAVVLFRASEHCAEHARETLELKPLPRVFWMQEGIECPESSRLLGQVGVTVLQNVCIKKEHERLLAGRPLLAGL